MGQAVETMIQASKFQRKVFERRWYDNNFFDDGYHFRFLSRSTNKIVDLSDRSTVYAPMRAIPKTSQQIRGMANLLISNNPVPTVYPKNISQSDYANPEEFKRAQEEASNIALRTGHWLTEEWKEQELVDKMIHMVILSIKHGVSYMQVWPDAVEEKILTQVYDAFDIYLMGNLTSMYDSPYVIKAVPQLISVIQANEDFDELQRLRILISDNRYSASEVKESYMAARFGRETKSDNSSTVILKEAFIKEYLNEVNQSRIRMQDDAGEILKGKKIGDMVMRQVFVANGIWLRDRYVDLPDYPFIDLRLEPGPIYQVPKMERFVNANKSLDLVISRLERYTHTMVTGTWMKRRGEGFKINNIAGGQIIEYDATPPVQGNIAPIPQFMFNLIELLTSFIEEQGVSTSALNQIPKGVKAHAAIESLKETERANLFIADQQVKKTIRHISERMLDIVDNYFVKPQTVYFLNKGKPDYFDIIGDSALGKRKKLKVETPDNVIPIKGDYKVEIEIESGMGYTKQGQKESMMELGNWLMELTTAGIISPNAMKYVVQKMLEVYKFGSYQEFMEALDVEGITQQMTENQLTQMKTAVLESLKEAGEIGPEGDAKDVQATKIGVLEALKESGLTDKIMGPKPSTQKPVSETLAYKDAPEDIKRQIEAQAGLTPSKGISPAGSEQIEKHMNLGQQATQADRQHQIATTQLSIQAKQAQQKNTKKGKV